MQPPSPFERPPDQESDHIPKWPWESASEKSQASESEKPDIKKRADKEKDHKKEQGAKKEKGTTQKEAKKESTENKKETPKPKEKPTETDEEKKTKRARLVEQSAAYAKHFEENSLPRDPATLARLLIAQQVLAVHEQLEHPVDSQTIDRAHLLATLDSMDALDKKLQDPLVEAAPEIEEAYEEIMLLAAETLEQEENLDDVVAANNTSTQQNSTIDSDPSPPAAPPATRDRQQKIIQPDSHTSPIRSSAAAGLILAIAHFRDRKKQLEQSPKPDSQASLTDIADRVPPSPYSVKSTPDVSRYSVDSTVRPPSSREPIASRPTTAHERTPSSQLDRHIPPGSTSPTVLAATAIATAAAVSRHPESRSDYTEIAQSPAPLREQASDTRGEMPLTPVSHETNRSRKIEHMPLNTLLQMAETVPIGHGRYLRRAYETGQIDKEGLIKILKSHNKGRDFFVEYRQQEARIRHLRAQSPEFLAATGAATSSMHDSPEQSKSQPSIKNTPEQSLQSSAVSPIMTSQPLPLLPSLAQAARNKPNTTRRLVLLVLATISIITLLGVIIFGLYSNFS